MALLHLNHESQYLGVNTEVQVILPDKPWGKTPVDFYGDGRKYPVLWLLHGTFGDASDWVRKSNIERYACERNVIVVMPSALNSDYANWPTFGTGFDMESYLILELMPMVHNWLPASTRREENFVAGLSMGGAGALKYAFAYPEKFAGVAALSAAAWNYNGLEPYAGLKAHEFRDKATSGSLDLPGVFHGFFLPRMVNIVTKYPTVGDFLDSSENLWKRFEELAPTGRLPDLYAVCGTKDFLYDSFCEFRALVEQSGVSATFVESEGLSHEWRLWDTAIERALEHFGLRKVEVSGPF